MKNVAMEPMKVPRTIIAIDPDSNKSGVALIVDGEIKNARSATLIELVDLFRTLDKNECIVVIENVDVDKCVYKRGESRPGVLTNIGMKVGMVKQRYRDICAFADSFGLQVFPVSPMAKRSAYIARAKKDAEFFKQLTGYQQRTNEEVRDAIMLGLYAPRSCMALARLK